MLKRQATLLQTAPDSLTCSAAPVPRITRRNLKRAARIRKEIDKLREQLAQVLEGRCR